MAEARAHDVSALTLAELEQVKRDLRLSMVLAMPSSPVRVTATAHLDAIDRELERRQPFHAPRCPSDPWRGLSTAG